jgi:predicted RNA-binding Zn-ribbon protein involved in translation (DUF1610 family)
MSIELNCTQCDRRLKVREELAGRRARCPECRALLEIPEPVLDAEELVASVESAEGTYAVAAPEPPKEPAEKRRPCPQCGEMILTDAVKCRYCGEIFDETLKRAARKQQGKPSDADLTVGEYVVAILFAGIGCIIGIVWMIQGKPKGTKMFVVSLVTMIVWTIINIAITGLESR